MQAIALADRLNNNIAPQDYSANGNAPWKKANNINYVNYTCRKH
ncbi:Uncharacterised protein [Edwardsiella hoshinae]|uniref:Uncharacterized protein n=1 Tax=Edwardsiella hoshinae TaxID=93378 RepID=A0A376DAJ0_9GAMM|nr:Uncharacterised protein [Edwardsiella hoshinae]